jgi:murein hydrolase activator
MKEKLLLFINSNSLKYYFFVFAYVALLGNAYAAPTNHEIQLKKNELFELQQQLDQQRRQLEINNKKEGKVLSTLQILKSDIAHTEFFINALEQQKNDLDSSISKHKSTLDSIQKKLKFQSLFMAQRARSLYISSPKSASQSEVNIDFDKTIALKKMLQHDRQLLNQFKNLKNNINNQLDTLNSQELELDSVQTQQSKERQHLTRQKNQQRIRLEKIQKDQTSFKLALAEFEANQKQLIMIIKLLEKKWQKEKKERIAREKNLKKKERDQLALKRERAALKLKKNGFTCTPLKGKIISRFGKQIHPELKTMTKNLGIKIQGKRNQVVKSVHASEVVFIQNIEGLGSSIILDHKNGFFSVYGELGKVKVKMGQKIKACKTIATLKNTPLSNKFFFQLQKGSKTLDPEPWIIKHLPL